MFMPDPVTGISTNISKTLQFPTTQENGTYGINATTYGRSLCVKFNINIPSNISNLISGFSIVRVQRTKEDKTILGQGIVYPTEYLKSNLRASE